MATLRPGSLLRLLEEALAVHGARLRALVARARSGGDEDLVHDVRVALRRLEALARLFRGVPGRRDGEAVRASARELRRRLSLLRSEEVGRALIQQRTGGPGGPVEAIVFPGGLPAVRVATTDLAKVSRALTGWRRRLASAFGGSFAPRVDAGADLGRKTRRRLDRRFRELSSLLPPRRKTLHACRIAAKRVRYALEPVEPLDPRIGTILRLLRAFQVAAGDAHDLVELAGRVRAAVGTGNGPAGAAALEAIARSLDADAARAISAARRHGAALTGPIRSLRLALGKAETR